MASSKGFYEYVVDELFSKISGISGRPMFGGYGIYKDGLFFALIADDELYFKVDDANKSDFEDAGSKPFVYTLSNGKTSQMNYYLLPPEIMEDHNELGGWVEKSVEVARKAKEK